MQLLCVQRLSLQDPFQRLFVDVNEARTGKCQFDTHVDRMQALVDELFLLFEQSHLTK